jgi:hypothetical protein
MIISILYTADCPNWQAAERNVYAALARLGVVDAEVRREQLTGAGDVERAGFSGSPSVLLDGQDALGSPESGDGWSCRLYRTADGVTTAPSVTQLADAIAAHRQRSGGRSS